MKNYVWYNMGTGEVVDSLWIAIKTTVLDVTRFNVFAPHWVRREL